MDSSLQHAADNHNNYYQVAIPSGVSGRKTTLQDYVLSNQLDKSYTHSGVSGNGEVFSYKGLSEHLQVSSFLNTHTSYASLICSTWLIGRTPATINKCSLKYSYSQYDGFQVILVRQCSDFLSYSNSNNSLCSALINFPFSLFAPFYNFGDALSAGSMSG